MNQHDYDVIVKGLTPAIDRAVSRSAEIRLNALDIKLCELDDIIERFRWLAKCFDWISGEYCLQLTKKQIWQALRDYVKAKKRGPSNPGGVDRRLL